MSALMTEQNIYATQFSEIVDRLPGRGLTWMDRLRKNAVERFLELGFPTTRLEEWKYTNVAPIRRHTFRPRPPNESLSEPLLSQLDLFPGPRLVFVDGLLDRKLSVAEAEDSGLQLAGLADSLADSRQVAMLESHL